MRSNHRANYKAYAVMRRTTLRKPQALEPSTFITATRGGLEPIAQFFASPFPMASFLRNDFRRLHYDFRRSEFTLLTLIGFALKANLPKLLPQPCVAQLSRLQKILHLVCGGFHGIRSGLP